VSFVVTGKTSKTMVRRGEGGGANQLSTPRTDSDGASAISRGSKASRFLYARFNAAFLTRQLSRSRRNLAFRGRMKRGRGRHTHIGERLCGSSVWPHNLGSLAARRRRSMQSDKSVDGAGSSARRLISATRAYRRIAAVSARTCSLRVCVAVAVWAWQVRVAVRLCGFGGTPLPGNDLLQLRLKLTT
jgi:hypothetical protein